MNTKKFVRIKEFYTFANKLLEIDETKRACSVLYELMPVELYDISLDILFNNNSNPKHKELRNLIKKVDDKLNHVKGFFETEPIDEIFKTKK